MLHKDHENTLINDYTKKIESIESEPALAKLVGESVDDLLRRQSDLRFAEVIKDEYLTHIIGCGIADQRTHALEAITIVIKLRPEIGAAWQEWRKHNDLNNWDASQKGDRRHSKGHGKSKSEKKSLRTSDPSKEEVAVVQHVSCVIKEKLDHFKTTLHLIPSAAYCRENVFFLSHPSIHDLLVKFVTDGLIVISSLKLGKPIYRPMQSFESDYDGFVRSKSALIMQILTQQMSMFNQTLVEREKRDALGQQYKMVQKKVVRPKVHSVMGVNFTMGKETIVKKVKVPISREASLTEMDRESIALQELLDTLAADLPFTIPIEFDLNFVQKFLELDGNKFKSWVREIDSLARNTKTNPSFLDERITKMRAELKNCFAEVAMLKIFYASQQQSIGITHLHKMCLSVSPLVDGYKEAFPFTYWELIHRPRELAVQFREAIKTKLSVNTIESCLMYIYAFQTEFWPEYETVFEEAIAILSGFALVFGQDPNAKKLIEMGDITAKALQLGPSAHKDAIKKAVYIYEGIQ